VPYVSAAAFLVVTLLITVGLQVSDAEAIKI